MIDEKIIETNSLKAWLLATRPKTLTGAIVPVMIGVALAWKDTPADEFQQTPALLCFLFAFIMQIDANLVNDYFDGLKGNDDSATRLGPRRACSEGWITKRAMKQAILAATFLACLVGLPLAYYGGAQMVAVGLACVFFCFLYTTRLSYLGLGDVLVLVFFGVVPVCCTYYVCLPWNHQTVTRDVVLHSLVCGLVIDTLLLVNNYRDRDNDRRDGKRTLVVRIGPTATEWLYLLLGFAPLAYIVLTGHGYLALAYLPFHLLAWRDMRRIHHGRPLNIILGRTARNMFIYGLFTTLSIIIGI